MKAATGAMGTPAASAWLRAPRRILVVDGADGREVQSVRRILGAAGDVKVAPVLPDGGDRGFDLTVVALPAPDGFWSRVNSRARLLALVDKPSRDGLAELVSSRQLVNLLGRSEGVDPEELLVTAEKLLRPDDVFGTDKYFGWGGRAARWTVGGSVEARVALEGVTARLSELGLPTRLRENVVTAVDELVSNALFNAPVDRATGRPRHAHLPRTHAVTLAADEAVEVTLRYDGRRVGVGVVDGFGTLSRPTVIRHLSAPEVRVKRDRVSAGVGLFLVWSLASHLVVNLAAGRRTEVIALFDVRGGSFREFAERAGSLNVFVSTEGSPTRT